MTLNGEPANINTPLVPNCEITIEPSTAGEDAVYTVGQLEEYHESSISVIVNGKVIVCPKFVQVNGSLEPASYEIKEGDEIETRNYYTVGQVAEFMDVEVDHDHDILVNNRVADFETLVYDNFSIDWTVLSFGVAPESENRYNATEGTERAVSGDTTDEQAAMMQQEQPESTDNQANIVVTVNGEAVELMGKESYIFVDIFDRITFDLTAGRGRAIATLINGEEAEFSQPLHDGDRIDLYWKEN